MTQTPLERLKDSVTREIEALNDKLAALDRLPVNLIAEAFPQGNWTNSYGSRYEFTLPFDFALIKTVKEFMSLQFPDFALKSERQFVWDESKDAGYFMEYSTGEKDWHEAVWFTIGFRISKKGSVCVMNQIGTKQVPVFEVICADGAKETL